jgi:hypothetical protein
MEVCMADLLSRKITRFDKVEYNRDGTIITLLECLKEVQGDKHKELIYRIRNVQDKKERTELKKALPIVTLSAIDPCRVSGHDPQGHSGLLQIDIDKKDNDRPMSEIRLKLENDSHVAAVFDSPSGGLKAVVAISEDINLHNRSFLAAKWFFDNLSISIDVHAKEVKRACFLTYDPDAWVADERAMIKVFEPVDDSEGSMDFHESPPCHSRNTDPFPYTNSISHTNTPFSQETLIQRFSELSKYKIPRKGEILAHAYKKLLLERYPVKSGTRNGTMIRFVVKGLSHFHPLIVREMMSVWYLDTSRFRQTETHPDHIGEVERSIRSMLEGWPDKVDPPFNGQERRIYSELRDEHEKTAFRRFRNSALQLPFSRGRKSLVAVEEPEVRLAVHLLCSKKKASGILKRFIKNGILDVQTRGEKYRKGTKAKATTYKYKLWQTKINNEKDTPPLHLRKLLLQADPSNREPCNV